MNLQDIKIQVRDPLATFLGGPEEVEQFTLSLLDVARFSGHLCPSVAGAFLVTKKAVEKLFEDGVCERGLLQVQLPGSLTDGANGPISNVIGYITGAWAESGFGGLGDKHCRRHLLQFNAKDLTPGQFRFIRSDTEEGVLITYQPQKANSAAATPSDFQQMWQHKVNNILSTPSVIHIQNLK